MQQIDSTVLDKIPPQDRQAEVSLLGALMMDNHYISNACTIVNREDFYDRRHQIIFEAIVDLFEQNIAADIVTVTDKLITMGQLEAIGGRAYLVELQEDVYSAANSDRYAEIVKEKAILRKLMSLSSAIFNKAQHMEGEVKDLLNFVESKVFEIAMHRTDKGFESIKTIVPVVLDRLEKAEKSDGTVNGLATGFKYLDEMTDGMHGGELIVVAGRPGMGKTSLALRIMEHVAVDKGKTCAIFSLEMSDEQIVQRILCSRARVSTHLVRSGRLPEHQYRNLTATIGPIAESPIFIDDSATMTIWDLRTKARLLKSQHNLELIVVDYLQLMNSGERAENRQQEISTISRSLKGLAKELDIPVIACSQLSRMVETRGGEKRPILADLRESGAIEQDADVVMFVYRPSHYKHTEEEREQIKGTDEENLAEIIIAKQRNGPTGVVKLTFLGEFIRFEDREYARSPDGNY